MNTSLNDGLRTPLWTPSEDSIRGSRMFDFARWAERRHGIELPDYPSLHAWSVEQMNEFWQGVWDYFDVVASRPGEQALSTSENSEADTGMPGAQWFPGARLNYAENSLRAARTRPDDVAIIGEHESRAPSTWTWGELEARVASVAQQLRDLGIVPGDRVAAVLPNLRLFRIQGVVGVGASVAG
ncbi:acetyl-coenzyme A synthetase N-terminal domain-containing protein [Kocuria marina]|uniref:acetyl-coenzyme A synthetase N-terminal domain-containing protein n=1 Tax=Kocuria marina TaxID=223184 RepID=UPI0016427300|nr:acetyl-coenzyme A synthetase N-terminal domain-containing protein [Kocuria indica]